ncbi:HNH endonuclease signature motif containing protein [Kitasatospora sp. NPDC052868]|uniref:HNH endonuclease signature motif containing protein n=1 Tax=Kitasatospora sp. NPDC052868 TaxID=3364060 RepID=UPI0037C70E43
MPVRYTRELLTTTAATAASLDEMPTALGREPNLDRRKYLRRKPTECAIDTSHFTGQAHNRCPWSTRRLPPERVLVQRPSDAKRLPGAQIRQALAELGRPEPCEDCGTGPRWRVRPITLEVDHINRDWSDNRPGNLRPPCPNCHAVTDTYCRPNRSKRAQSSPTRNEERTTPRNDGVPSAREALD